ncbi:MAG: Nif3-like dinuclear metal center hexameric protein, partial [Mycobacteriales bacterium]
MAHSRTVADVMAAMQLRYPAQYAQDWDRIGLVCGEPASQVRAVSLVVDVTDETVAQAVEIGADLLIAHHPLLLAGVHSVATDTSKGRLLHRLITAGIALYVAHTNADAASPGVSDALAVAIGLN